MNPDLICNYAKPHTKGRCIIGLVEQHPDEFIGKKGQKTVICKTCRIEQARHKRNSRLGIKRNVGSRGNAVRPVRELEPGDPPKMLPEDRRIFRKWLIELIGDRRG